MKKRYMIAKGTYNGNITFIDYDKIDGLKISPKNKIEYPGIKVNSMIIIKPSFIEKILKRKIKIKLEYYLSYIISLISSDDDDDTAFRQALNSLTRFKDVIEYKYRKYLDDKYINILLKKLDLLEKEVKSKLIYKQLEENKKYIVPEEKVEERRRSR